jgi:hypothetical protein
MPTPFLCVKSASLAAGGLLLAAAAASAPAAELPRQSYLGAFNNPGCCGSSPDLGFVLGTVVPGNPINGNFGVEFVGPSLVESFTFAQVADPGRHRPQNITVHTSPTQSFNFMLADTTAPQTLTFPSPVEASYLLVLVNSQYTTGSGDSNFGLTSLTADGTYLGTPDNNVNRGITPVSAGGLGGFDNPVIATNGDVVSNANTNKATYFARNAGQDSLTVSYASPQSVAQIGLGLETYGVRDIPKFVNILDSNGGSQTITLAPDQLQYGRYTLASPIANTTSLTLQFPDGGDPNNFFINGDANYGVTEFEAFAVIPEPASFGIVCGLGVLALTARRRRPRPV